MPMIPALIATLCIAHPPCNTVGCEEKQTWASQYLEYFLHGARQVAEI
jgi:hypothetical protein